MEEGGRPVTESEEAAVEPRAGAAAKTDAAASETQAQARAAQAAKAERAAQKRAAKEEKAERRRRAKARKAERRRAARAEKDKRRRPAAKAVGDEPKPERKPRRGERKPPAGARAGGAAGGVARRTGSAINSALTGPRARSVALRVDRGIQTAWRWILAGLGSLLAGLLVIARLGLGGLQEIGSFWIRTAEILGTAILRVEARVRPVLVAILRAARRGLAVAERVVTPERAVAVVVIAAAGTLAASQFVDYRGVEIGAPAYAGVESVAPAPQTEREVTGSVHGYAMVPVAVVVVVAALLALHGRWRLARVIPVLGALAIAVTLLLDARRGLDEGGAGIAYEGARAVLIEGFWLQLFSAAVLVFAGALLVRYARLRAEPAARHRPSSPQERPPRRRRRFRIAGVRA